MFLIGADPELFVKKAGELVSGWGLIPGTKENPHVVNNGAVQVDGMALEFNIDPSSTEEEFIHNVTTVIAQMQAMIPDYELVADPVAPFGAAYIATQPEGATMLGCDVDFNAWKDGECNPNPDAEADFRTGAGHVHIGWTEGASLQDTGHKEDCLRVIKQLDFFLGLPSLLFDEDSKRRELYGKAGAYRPKSYGAEYRVLSNKWVGDIELTKWVYRATIKALNELANGNYLPDRWDIATIINTSDVESAKVIIKEENLETPYDLG